MDQYVTQTIMTNIMECKVENEDDLSNYESKPFIKEEFIISDEPENFDYEESSAANSTLRSEIPFVKLYGNDLTYIERISTKDDTSCGNAMPNDIGINNFDNNSSRINQNNIKMEVDPISSEEFPLFDESGTFQCKGCNYRTKNRTYFRRHLRRQHMGNNTTCPKCGKKNIKKEYMWRHSAECGKEVPNLKCKFCNYNTMYKLKMEKHMRNLHRLKPHQYADIIEKIIEEGTKIKGKVTNSMVPKQVNVVPKIIQYKELIKLYCTNCNEINEYTNDKDQRDCPKCGAITLLQCIKCAKRCPMMSTMYSHLYSKCAAENTFQCADCDYVTTYKKCLQVHIRRKHFFVASKYQERCSKCYKKYKCRFYRISHEKLCDEEPVFKCKLCPFKSKSNAYFKRHMQDHILHPTVDDTDSSLPVVVTRMKGRMNFEPYYAMEKLMKPFCPKCKESVEYVKYRRKQCYKCKTKLTYPCVKCDKVYSMYYKLWAHMISVHLNSTLKKRSQCPVCHRQFNHRKNLQAHQCHGTKPVELQCAHCHFKTNYKHSLAKHLQIKHDDRRKAKMKRTAVDAMKQFVCAKCGKCYKRDGGLTKHMLQYCGKERYLACDHCSFKTSKRNSLIIHLKGAHNDLFIGQELRCKHCGKESSNVYQRNCHIANCLFK